MEVQREWVDRGASTRFDLGVTPQNMDKKGSGLQPFTLERWQNESMSEQPYHNIGAVWCEGLSQEQSLCCSSN